MSFGIGLGSLITTIEGCIKTHNKITPPETQIDDIQERLSQILKWLIPINNHLNTKYGPSIYFPETPKLRATVTTMSISANEISNTFTRFHTATRTNNTSPSARTIQFAAGNTTRHITTHLTTLESKTTSLSKQVTNMDRQHLRRTLIPVRPTPPLHNTTKLRPNLRILFIDDRNTGRSVLAQGYAQLLRDFTLHCPLAQPFHISTIHSASLHIRDTTSSGLSALQNHLQLPYASSGQTPSLTGLTTLLDHPSPLTNGPSVPHKRVISRQLKTQMSRGISNTTFNSYDYIFVFSYADNLALHKLKSLVRRTYGSYAAPRGKARIVMLGEYAGSRLGAGAGSGSGSSEIEAVSASVVGERERRKEWERVMERIRVCFRSWLSEELGWVRPDGGR